jgi:hypothetical protein
MAKKKAKSKYTEKMPTSFGSFCSGDQVTFNRISDGALSIGRVWYFYVDIERPCVLLIDLLLGNFQLGYVDELNSAIPAKKRKALWAKAKARGIRP